MGFPQKPNWVLIALFLVLGGFLIVSGTSGLKETDWQTFRSEKLTKGKVKRLVVVNRERVEVYLKKEAVKESKDIPNTDMWGNPNNGPHSYFNMPPEVLQTKLKKIKQDHPELAKLPIKYQKRTNWARDIIFWLLPLALIIGLWIFIMRRVQKGAGGGPGSSILNIGKSKAKVYEKGEKTDVTFKDVAGLDEPKTEIQEVVDFLRHPDKYSKLGARIPKGVLMVGPPGTGKTLMGKAVAGEAEVPFFSISGSDFVEMFVGVGSARVRDMFAKAKEKAPCIIFIDEIDAIGRTRGTSRSMQSNDERESTLNQLLQEMDGFDTNSGIIVVAATNRADVLDNALLRPGRFDRHISLELPNLDERKAIFEVHIDPIQTKGDLDTHLLASQTAGFSGADIANVCNEAALIAARIKKEAVEMDDFVNAMDRVIAGMEKKGKVISDDEKKVIAYHEAGHAIISWLLEKVDPLVKVSIIPRGQSLGSNWYLPRENSIKKESEFFQQMCAALGGRAAEEVVFEEVSSGALNDLEKVTKQAYTMVAMYGLSEKLGNISYHDSTGEYSNSLQKPYSEGTGQIIDQEIRELVEKGYEEALRIIREHRNDLQKLAELLIEKEVIYGEDLENVLGKRPEQTEANEEAELEKKAEASVKAAQEKKQDSKTTASINNNGQETRKGREDETPDPGNKADDREEKEEEKNDEEKGNN
ncbi:MAG: ATP-dependent zinc metalloprotease FtsH [Flavobacteriales bacterium]